MLKLVLGSRLGNYRLIKSLGAGAAAYVYLGEHVHIKTQAAIKVVDVSSHVSREDLRQFENEARTIANLRHPNIVGILDFGIEDGLAYLIMEYAALGSFRSKYPKGTVLPLSDIVSYARQIALALQHAHEHNIVHRDVKPDNILLRANGEVLLGDFGIARTIQDKSRQSEAVGTLRYMAPEQFDGKALPASDQYSLGVMVYEWFCGHVPFTGRNFAEICHQHVSMPVPSLRKVDNSITEELEFIVCKALAKKPSDRYKSVQAFAEELEDAVEPTLPVPPFVDDVPARVIDPLPAADNALMSLLPSISSLQRDRRPEENPLHRAPAPPSSSEAIELLPPASAFLPRLDGSGA